MTPVIGISCSHLSDSVQCMLAQVKQAGGQPVLLDNHSARCANNDLSAIHGLVLMGNDFDIDPSDYCHRYPEDDPRRSIHPSTKSESNCPQAKARAVYEYALLDAALACGTPTLTICGGMQRLNVLCGGTLHQHVPDMVGSNALHQRDCGISPHIPTISVVIKPHTKLAMIACDIKMGFATTNTPDAPKVIRENSLRHQSIDMLGQGLRIAGLSDSVTKPDGTKEYLVEAIEADPNGAYASQFLLGVQFHPEFAASELGPKIIGQLVQHARQFTLPASSMSI
jgi:putative glutamine amidotransferase